MVKKIKVVELNTSNPEATAEPNVEQEAAPDPTPMQEPESVEPVAIPDSLLEEPKAKKPRQPRQPREPRPAREPREPRAPREQKLIREPPPSDSDSIDTEEMVAVIKNHRASKKQPAPAKEEPPVAQTEAQAKEEKATCPDCNKVMSVKSLKYTHANNCKAKQLPPSFPFRDQVGTDPSLKGAPKQQPMTMVESVEPSRPVQHPISVLLAAERVMRMGQRRERIETLLSNAF